MSVQRKVKSPEQIKREKKIKRLTGYETDHCRCTICGKEFTDREIDNDESLFSIGRISRMVMHEECYRKEYFNQGGQTHDQNRSKRK